MFFTSHRESGRFCTDADSIVQAQVKVVGLIPNDPLPNSLDTAHLAAKFGGYTG
jgi:hypothetical protein